jgi:predicted aspartyl protease
MNGGYPFKGQRDQKASNYKATIFFRIKKLKQKIRRYIMFQLFKKLYVALLLLILIIGNGTIGRCDGNEILAGGRLVSTNIVSEVPFEFFGSNMLIKAKINNSEKEYTFIFDTGASTVVSKKVADQLSDLEQSQEIKNRDAANVTQMAKVTRLKALQVGNIAVENCAAVIFDFNELESYGLKVDGILGHNFLKFLLVKIDYNKKVLTLSSKTDNSEQPNQGYRVKLFQDNSGLISTQLQIGIAGSPSSWLIQKAVIDTGASGYEYLHFPFNCLGKVKPELNCNFIKTIGSGSGGVYGQSESFYSRLATMELGGFKISNVPICFSNSPIIFITNIFLSHFIVTINYPKLEMYLLPNDKPFKTNIYSYGFMAKRDQNGKVRIIGIWEGSPAESNGLKIGDEIINMNVNGKDVTFEKIVPYIVSDQDDTLCLQVVNSLGKREVVLKKANLLPEIIDK